MLRDKFFLKKTERVKKKERKKMRKRRVKKRT